MTKNSKHKLLLTTIILTAILVSSAYAVLIPNAQAMKLTDITTKDKGLLVLNTAVGLNVSKYSVTTNEVSAEKQTSYMDVLPQEDIEYTLLSGENMLKAHCTFVDGHLMILNVLENSGPPSMLKAEANAKTVDMAKDFMVNYQTYTADSLYGKLKSSLEGVDAGKNATKTSGNAQLDVTVLEGRTTFRWTYVSNGAIAPSKVVALSFKNGFLDYFVDKWNFYNVGNAKISLSKDDAVAIALKTAKAYDWSINLDADALVVKNFNESNVRWTSLIFDDSTDAGKARNEDILTVYPVWRVGVALDKWYGNVYGIQIDVWADSGEVRCVQEAWSSLTPTDVATAHANEKVAKSEVELNLVVLIGVPTAALALLGLFLFWVARKKKVQLHSLLKPNVLKTGGILLCALISSTILLGAITTVNATTRAGVVWGSESNEAIDPNTEESWRKHQDEIDLQREMGIAIECYFDNNGYTGVNHQGNLGSTKSQILSDISYYQSNYDYLAVVHFDHGIGRPDYIHYLFPQFGYPFNQEFHYMIEDDNGTVWGPSFYNQTTHPEHGVYDTDIWPLIQQGNKIVFALINTCLSANLTSQTGNPSIGQGYLEPYWPVLPARYEGMPYAWTHRLVKDKSMQGFNIAQHISDDGYNDPDTGSQVYIGFPWGSASLMQKIPYPSGTHNYRYWLGKFFSYAFDNGFSVNQALDKASELTWSCSFEESPLQGDGFTAYWWNGNPETMGGSTMAVYGNGNIFLKNFEPHFVSAPSVAGPDEGYASVSYEFSACSIDPSGHDIQYTFDWGDGSQNVTGWYDSGEVATMSHTWSTDDVYYVKVKAQCDQGLWSSWSSQHTIVIGDFPVLTVKAYRTDTGNELINFVPVWIDDEYVGTAPYSCYVSGGSNHKIEVPDDMYLAWFNYYNYGDDNPITLSVTSDKTVKAYYTPY